jgi:hypothetical protein
MPGRITVEAIRILSILCEIWGFRCGVAEDLSVLGCDTVLLGEYIRHFEGPWCIHIKSQGI